MIPPPNIVVIVSDTMRTGHLGCYGNPNIQTPSIDAFAKRGTRFTRAYPESLPTVPARRAFHTGRRAYPFRDYRPVPWDLLYLPGWQPLHNDEDTLAENLAGAGYQTGFVTDTLPYFAPGYNFYRGFWQWEYIRGQQQDKWRSAFALSDEQLRRYGNPAEMLKKPHDLPAQHVANTAHVKAEDDTSTVKTFKWGMQFIEDNCNAGRPFYLMMDFFDPHEPWEAPDNYYALYGDPNYSGRRIIHCGYGPADKFGYTPDELHYVEAQYCGLVTMLDTWFGKFMARLGELGLAKNTAVFFISDHGTNFCRNPRRIIGKPSAYLYPGTVHLPLLVRLPDGSCAGETRDEIVYNIDMVATIYDLAGVESEQGIDGRSLMPLLSDEGAWTGREYATTIYGNDLCCIDDRTWLLTNTKQKLSDAFDLESDPDCQVILSEEETKGRLPLAWDRLLADAGGEFPDCSKQVQEARERLLKYKNAPAPF